MYRDDAALSSAVLNLGDVQKTGGDLRSGDKAATASGNISKPETSIGI